MLRIEKNFLNMKNLISIIYNKDLSKRDLKVLLLMIEDIKNPKDIIIMSRKRIAKKTGLHMPNISLVINKLIDLELIIKLEDGNIYKLGSVLYEDIDFKKSKL